MKVILTGGGTGGHIYPALAVGWLLKEKLSDVEILYVGTEKGLESEIVPGEGIDFMPVRVEGFPRKLSVKLFSSAFSLLKGIQDSKKILDEFLPDIVIATGGYVCGPISYLAAKRGIKLVIHEQNVVPGLTNRMLAGKADLICTTFEDSVNHFPKGSRVVVTGLPVRSKILDATRMEGAEGLGLDPSKFIILVTGGSRGAGRLNVAMTDVIKYYGENESIHIILITGKAGYETFLYNIKKEGVGIEGLSNVTILPYLHEMHHALGCADLVVGRAGATFISEITTKGIPAILVPYPNASNNHQELNASALVDRGAAVMIKDKELNGKNLIGEIKKLVSDKNKLEGMREKSKLIGKRDAGDRISNLVINLLK